LNFTAGANAFLLASRKALKSKVWLVISGILEKDMDYLAMAVSYAQSCCSATEICEGPVDTSG
jgi:hypothetical protein